MEVWGQLIDIDLRKVRNVNSFISRQYSDDVSDDEVNDGVDSQDEKNESKHQRSKSFNRSTRSTHRSFLQAMGTHIPTLIE